MYHKTMCDPCTYVNRPLPNGTCVMTSAGEGLFTQNMIFVLHRVIRQCLTQLGLILIWSDTVVQHDKT
jgi:hypothetical protein